MSGQEGGSQKGNITKLCVSHHSVAQLPNTATNTRLSNGRWVLPDQSDCEQTLVLAVGDSLTHLRPPSRNLAMLRGSHSLSIVICNIPENGSIHLSNGAQCNTLHYSLFYSSSDTKSIGNLVPNQWLKNWDGDSKTRPVHFPPVFILAHSCIYRHWGSPVTLVAVVTSR